jgi:hypothetical protein
MDGGSKSPEPKYFLNNHQYQIIFQDDKESDFLGCYSTISTIIVILVKEIENLWDAKS